MRKLIVFDVDSTLINEEVIELFAKSAGVLPEVRRITDAAMSGRIDFEESLRKRVSLLKGLPSTIIDEVRQEITLTEGARDLIVKILTEGHVPAVVSGGFTSVLEPLMKELEIEHYRANALGIQNGKLTGEVEGTVVDRKAKAFALQEFANIEGIEIENTIAIGDGANDIDMVELAGLGIAFCAKDALIRVADVSITKRDLRQVILYL
jgi:phosphoserine phosphatase